MTDSFPMWGITHPLSKETIRQSNINHQISHIQRLLEDLGHQKHITKKAYREMTEEVIRFVTRLANNPE